MLRKNLKWIFYRILLTGQGCITCKKYEECSKTTALPTYEKLEELERKEGGAMRFGWGCDLWE